MIFSPGTEVQSFLLVCFLVWMIRAFFHVPQVYIQIYREGTELAFGSRILLSICLIIEKLCNAELYH